MDCADALHYYFAYGSNMNPKRMKNRGVSFIARKLGQLPGYTLVFNKKINSNGTAAANILVDEKSTVFGALYACRNEDVFHQLDKYEGVRMKHYYREKKTIFLENGAPVVAFVYVAYPVKCEEDLKIHPNYLEHLLSGEDILPEKYLNFLHTFKEKCCEDETVYFFAYGADADRRRMDEREVVITNRDLGVVHDYQMVFNKLKKNGMLAPNLVPSESSLVYGVLYSFHDNQPFAKLDKANGVSKGHYHRSPVLVHKESGRAVRAQTYFAGSSFICEAHIKVDPDTFYNLVASKDILPRSYLESLIQGNAETSHSNRLLEELKDDQKEI